MSARIAEVSERHASLAPPPATDAELAYIFDVADCESEIDEELSAALVPYDD